MSLSEVIYTLQEGDEHTLKGVGNIENPEVRNRNRIYRIDKVYGS